jgi:hypothetical protein
MKSSRTLVFPQNQWQTIEICHKRLPSVSKERTFLIKRSSKEKVKYTLKLCPKSLGKGASLKDMFNHFIASQSLVLTMKLGA